MTVGDKGRSFRVGIDFESVLRAISKQVYETPLAFIRENVQNAVDAIRIQAHRDQVLTEDDTYRIDVDVEADLIRVRDNGTGMSASDLENYFWTIGASGKRTEEAIAAGCVGMFGIGGFANFGVCHTLEVISQTPDSEHGTLTRLSEADIKEARGTIPSVSVEESDQAGPRGTLVIGYLREPANLEDLRRYLQESVRFVPTAVYFNGQKLSQNTFTAIEDRENMTAVENSPREWQDGDLSVVGRFFEDRGHTLVASIHGLSVGSEPVNLRGHIRFENGPFDVYKRGFKLCGTSIGTTIGVSGRLDCDSFTPTAGRDSLDAPTASLLSRIALALERVAVDVVLDAPERISQYTRIFRYLLQRGLVGKIGNVRVRLADGSENTLANVRRSAERGVRVFYGITQKQALNQVMQARGHIVVLLSSDRHRQQAERQYLEKYCSAKAFDGVIACQEHYDDLSRFEKVFLSELEQTISKAYEIENFRLIPGNLTEDVPVFVKEASAGQTLNIFVDVRHSEIVKLEALGYTPLLYSLIVRFCNEFLGHSLRKWSPRFFGDGALNLELLAKRRTEFWLLLKEDIGVIRRGGQRHVVTRSDVQVVTVGSESSGYPEPPSRRSIVRILHIVDDLGTTGVGGYYIRLPNSANRAYGDLLQECDSRGVHWGGNKIQYVASDTVSAAFQYEILLDEVIATEVNGELRGEGAAALDRPLQEMYGGLYFPIPLALERFLVPHGDTEIRLQLTCDWFDMRTAKHWIPKETDR